MSPPNGLESLSRTHAPAVPAPAMRWRTRILLPGAILIAVGAMLAYAARDTLRPRMSVTVAPVVARSIEKADGASPQVSTGIAVQAPGWIEPDPYPISVAALAEGVAEEVLFLEGQPVKKGDAMVKLVSIDASLNVARIRAELDSLAAGVNRAKANAAAEAARVAEVEDEERRTAQSAAGSAATESELIRVRARLTAQIAARDSATAAIAEASSNYDRCKVMCQEADLNLERMTVRAPADGVVLTRLIEPGTRISLSDSQGSSGNSMGVVARLYDPAKLQVRVEVPLADVSKLAEHMPAEIETEAVPNRVFKGHISRIVHEANIQRNTVQVKVAIEDPIPTLKPEMLARVRLRGGTPSPSAPSSSAGDGFSLLVPTAALIDANANTASVWLIDQRHTTVSLRKLTLTGRTFDDHAEIADGLSPGDRVVVNPPQNLRENAGVRPQEGR